MVKITTTKISSPPRLIIYGDHKMGKSTFAAGTPSPIFIQTESGLDSLGVEAFEFASTLDMVLEQLLYLKSETHDYKTCVIDSADWLERLIWADICKTKGWEQIGDGHYGAGYKLAMNTWKQITNMLESLNKDRGMMILWLAHAKIVKFEDPERDNYDRWDLDLHDKAGKLINQYVDIIGFCSQKIVTVKSDAGFGQKDVKAKSTDERLLNLNKKAGFEAGNRFSLPDQIPLGWDYLKVALQDAISKRKEGNLSKAKDKREMTKLMEQSNG